MVKDIIVKEEAKQKLVTGVNKVADIVSLTLGPRGQNVVLERGEDSPPLITNDGISIAREITPLKDRFENMGAQLIIEVASKTNDVSGDGTTTSTVLTREIVNNGMLAVSHGNNPILLKEGMKIAVQDITKAINSIKRDIESLDEIEKIATISSGDNYIGSLIGDAMKKMGKDGIIMLDDSENHETTLTISEGYEIGNGFLNHLMITDPKREKAVLHEPYIFVTGKVLKTMSDVLPAMEIAAKSARPLVIVAENIEGQAIENILINMSAVQTLVVKAPGFGEDKKELLQDIACVTGAKFLPAEGDIKLITQEYLGTAKIVEADKDKTCIMNGKRDEESFRYRVENIRSKAEKENDTYIKESLEERLAKMNAGIAIIKCGAKTETEQTEKKLRIEDAINATKVAVKHGVVAGGGIALLKAYGMIEDYKKPKREEIKRGYECVVNSLHAPINQILSNANLKEDEIVDIIKKLKSENDMIGYDAMDFEFRDFYEVGIIDPARVTISALENATSVAGTLLTTNAAIISID